MRELVCSTSSDTSCPGREKKISSDMTTRGRKGSTSAREVTAARLRVFLIDRKCRTQRCVFNVKGSCSAPQGMTPILFL